MKYNSHAIMLFNTGGLDTSYQSSWGLYCKIQTRTQMSTPLAINTQYWPVYIACLWFCPGFTRARHVLFSISLWSSHHQVNGHWWPILCAMHTGQNGSLNVPIAQVRKLSPLLRDGENEISKLYNIFGFIEKERISIQTNFWI